VINKVLEGGSASHGFDAANEVYGDMFAMGIIDPAKVTRSALQNASSIASLIITTEAMVADLPKKDGGAAPAGGGMGDMGM
jgi:chaperonin GroEL